MVVGAFLEKYTSCEKFHNKRLIHFVTRYSERFLVALCICGFVLLRALADEGLIRLGLEASHTHCVHALHCAYCSTFLVQHASINCACDVLCMSNALLDQAFEMPTFC